MPLNQVYFKTDVAKSKIVLDYKLHDQVLEENKLFLLDLKSSKTFFSPQVEKELPPAQRRVRDVQAEEARVLVFRESTESSNDFEIGRT